MREKKKKQRQLQMKEKYTCKRINGNLIRSLQMAQKENNIKSI